MYTYLYFLDMRLIPDFFNKNSKPINTTWGKLMLEMKCHLRYENGVLKTREVSNCSRMISIEPNYVQRDGASGYTVTLFNMMGPDANWRKNIQMAPKTMNVIDLNDSGAVLKGYGVDTTGQNSQDFGLTIHVRDNDCVKVVLHLMDRGIDLEYYSDLSSLNKYEQLGRRESNDNTSTKAVNLWYQKGCKNCFTMTGKDHVLIWKGVSDLYAPNKEVLSEEEVAEMIADWLLINGEACELCGTNCWSISNVKLNSTPLKKYEVPSSFYMRLRGYRGDNGQLQIQLKGEDLSLIIFEQFFSVLVNQVGKKAKSRFIEKPNATFDFVCVMQDFEPHFTVGKFEHVGVGYSELILSLNQFKKQIIDSHSKIY